MAVMSLHMEILFNPMQVRIKLPDPITMYLTNLTHSFNFKGISISIPVAGSEYTGRSLLSVYNFQ